ncbi:uncharacterized protein L969DRAFT_94074 [Mixia osmundae IAM 14324]|uniref:V-type proton ATPase subunit C n=1 Tax=Mixia osmundae (strain CBS 9802 / IAM 14324 / JCM 22182 / KY 12970) TaxID=764103 RepID=G7E905_MIXOS|nr:uncharacterized protein L969DRAFT_94074 [Mixia osmundae IAM 14324]KEI40259.1 hypothetical protein L969DRAFT_94074 [Mixia osmundae IAM 14324]GAA99623.1 hypothetical protein E5Q_06324 [Mixia osmundae IAM 14324]
MPSGSAIWLVASPPDGDASEQIVELDQKLNAILPSSSSSTATNGLNKLASSMPSLSTSGGVARVAPLTWPPFKTGTLSSLLKVSETCNKYDNGFTSSLNKIVETLRSLDADSLGQHLVIDEGQPWQAYLLDGWEWNRAKYRVEGKPLEELVESLQKEMSSLEAIHKQKQTSYNATKQQLAGANRKRTGNLSTRDLSTVLNKEDSFGLIQDSEYLEQLYVAVPKNSIKDWHANYESLTSMVVPRSSIEIVSDEDFTLFSVTIFRKVKDEFTQKARDHKFVVREFRYDEDAVQKQQSEQDELERSEKDQWTDLLRLCRINFSEAFQVLVHLKVIRAFVECVLRYGLPAHYFGAFVKPEPKQAKKAVQNLQTYFAPFTPKQDRQFGGKKKSGGDEGLVGEYQSMMEAELFDFVLFEVDDVEISSR